MEEIKELVAQALEQRHVLSRLKAELRAQVFLAIDEQERSNGGPGLATKTDNSKRAALLSSTTGKLLAGLVHEFLAWTGMEFTLKVYEPEMGVAGAVDRHELAEQLDTPAAAVADEPLLMQLLDSWQRASSGDGTARAQAPAPSSKLPTAAAGTQPPQPATPAAAAPAAAGLDAPSVLPAARKPLLQPLQPLQGGAGEAPAASAVTSPPALGLQSASKIPPAPATAQPPAPAPAPTAASKPAAAAAPPAPAAAHAVAPPAAAAPAAAAPAAGAGDHSYADDVDVDIDDDLADAEIMDDDEDYAAVFAPGIRPRRTSTSGSGNAVQAPSAPVPTAPSGRRTSGTGQLGDAATAPAASAIAAAAAGGEAMAATEAAQEVDGGSSLSGSFPPGRMRASKLRAITPGASSLQEDGLQSSLGGLQQASGDLLSGDRSFGYSHELAGLAPGSHPLLGTSHSGKDLSYSGELMGPGGGTDSGKTSPTSKASPTELGPKGESARPASKLQPLGPPGGSLKPGLPGKLAPLAPLGKAAGGLGPAATLAPASGSLSASGLSGLAPPMSAGTASRKDPNDIKAELRRAGLLTSDSYSVDLTKSNSGGDSQVSLDLPDNTPARPAAAGGTLHAHRRASDQGEEEEEEEAEGPTRAKQQQQQQGGAGGAVAAKPAATLRPLHGGVYDAEVSVMTSASQSMEIATEVVDEDSRSTVSSEALPGTTGLPGSRPPQLPGPGGREYTASKGVSMDLRDTGLSTSDKSADDADNVFANADFAETAEWGS